MAEGKYDSALIYAEKVIAMNDRINNGYGLRGDIYLFSEKFDMAIKDYLKAIELPPHDNLWIWWHIALGRAYFRTNDMVNAIRYINRGYELSNYTQDKAVQWLGICYANLGDYERARGYYFKFLENDVEDCWTIREYAMILGLQLKYDDALVFLDSLCIIRNSIIA